MKAVTDFTIAAWAKDLGPDGKGRSRRADENLSLRTDPILGGASAHWVFRGTLGGKPWVKRLGRYPEMKGPEARFLARELRERCARGETEGEIERQIQKEAGSRITLAECAERYFEERDRTKLTGVPYIRECRSMFRMYVNPICGDVPVAVLGRANVREIVTSMINRPQRCHATLTVMKPILDYAQEHEWRDVDKANAFTAILQSGIVKQFAALSNMIHYPSVDYNLMPQLLDTLRAKAGSVRRRTQLLSTMAALEFLIYTVVRKSNAAKARWADIDLEKGLWTIRGYDPKCTEERGSRMKTKATHIVPLSSHALKILEPRIGNHPTFVFPGIFVGRPMHDLCLTQLLTRAGYKDDEGKNISVHGLRATFTQWARDHGCTSEMCEQILAHETRVGHTIKAYDRVVRAKGRLPWLEAWGNHCNGLTGSYQTMEKCYEGPDLGIDPRGNRVDEGVSLDTL